MLKTARPLFFPHRLISAPYVSSAKFMHLRNYSEKAKISKLRGPKIKLLDDMVSLAQNNSHIDLSKTLIVGCQHMLESTESLFSALVKLKAKPENMHFMGKWYSTSTEVENSIKSAGVNITPALVPKRLGYFHQDFELQANHLWDNVLSTMDTKQPDIEGIIVLDEGGVVLETVPKKLCFTYPIIGIEQTRGGLYNHALNNLTFPIIEVASCAAKRYLESRFIAEAVTQRIDSVINEYSKNQETVFGIIGNGAIGSALTKYLLENNFTVLNYNESQDPSPFPIAAHKNLFIVDNKNEVLANSDVILGCTGQDISAEADITKEFRGDTVLISCSSSDIEFRNLLQSIPQTKESGLKINGNVEYIYRNHNKVTIVNRGFPINFDRTPISVPSDKIAITRGLLLGACIQAYFLNEDKNIKAYAMDPDMRRHMLDSNLQKYIVEHWEFFNDTYFNQILLERFKDPKWIERKSGGTFNYNSNLVDVFETNQTCLNNSNLRSELDCSAEEEKKPIFIP